ncbi:hypothetical protein JCM8097_007214 [Rhodosporidiobolus ruineniae]
MPASTSSQPARRATYQPLPPSSPHPPSNPPSSATSMTPAASPNTTSQSTPAHQAAQQAQQPTDNAQTAHRGEGTGSGWEVDEMADWPVAGGREEYLNWTDWVLNDHQRYPPLAHARFAGASATLDRVRTQLDQARQQLADVDGAVHLDWLRRTAAEMEVRMWVAMKEFVLRLTGDAETDLDREQRLQDQRFVADGGDPAGRPASYHA